MGQVRHAPQQLLRFGVALRRLGRYRPGSPVARGNQRFRRALQVHRPVGPASGGPRGKRARLRGVDEVAKLNHAVLEDCCKAQRKRYACRAATIHTLERYLVANGLIVDPELIGKAGAITLRERSSAASPNAERATILKALEEASGGQVGGPEGAVARLGLKRTTLQSRMRKYNIARQFD